MTHLDDTFQIETPENVAFGYTIAGIGSRFLAAVWDTFLLVLLQLLVYIIILFVAYSQGDLFDPAESTSGPGLFTIILGLLSFILFWGYYIFYEMLWNGQSPGKRWVGLRVLRVDGTPITLTESLVRNLIRLIDFMPMAYGVGIISMFINHQSRRLGDLAAGTVVVYDQPISDVDMLIRDSRHGYDVDTSPVAGLPLNRLTEQDLQMIESYLDRRMTFHPETAHSLGQQILEKIYAKLDAPLPEEARSAPDPVLKAIVQWMRENSNS